MLSQSVPPEEHLLMEPAEQRLLPDESVSGELDLELAAVGIQVDIKPEICWYSSQV